MRAEAGIVVIGVGNAFRRDDGVGWAVLSRLGERVAQGRLPGDVVLAACDGEPARLIGLWADAGLALVVDAVHALPASPGRVHRLEQPAALSSRSARTSSHGLGLAEAVELARELGRLPGRLVLFGVEGEDDSLGPGLSGPVSATVVPVADRIEQEIAEYRRGALLSSSAGPE
jgi:hydrogenase maturation protease